MNEMPSRSTSIKAWPAQKATDIRRAIVEVEVIAKLLRQHQAAVELQPLRSRLHPGRRRPQRLAMF
jgi:hypothetical protein